MSNITAKRVSNYELFYDLIFVLATSGLTSLLHTEHFSWDSLEIFIIASIGLLSIWFYETVYLNKFGERDGLDIYTIIAGMFILGQMAINMTVTPTQNTLVLYQFYYAASYAIISLQYILRSRKNGLTADMRPHRNNVLIITACYIATTLAAALGWLSTYSYLIFPIICIPLILPLLLRNLDMKEAINFPHLLERCQLITIITFGETVIAVIKSYPFASYPLESILFFVGMAFLFVRYISQTHLNINHHQVANTQALIYSHLFLVMGINLFTVGLEMLVNPHHAQLGFTYFIAGILIAYLGILALNIYNHDHYRINQKHVSLYLLTVIGACLLMIFARQSLLAVSSIFALFSWSMPRINYYFRKKQYGNQAIDPEASEH